MLHPASATQVTRRGASLLDPGAAKRTVGLFTRLFERTDPATDPLPPATTIAKSSAPGWDAIDRVLAARYGQQEPRHYATLLKYASATRTRSTVSASIEMTAIRRIGTRELRPRRTRCRGVPEDLDVSGWRHRADLSPAPRRSATRMSTRTGTGDRDRTRPEGAETRLVPRVHTELVRLHGLGEGLLQEPRGGSFRSHVVHPGRNHRVDVAVRSTVAHADVRSAWSVADRSSASRRRASRRSRTGPWISRCPVGCRRSRLSPCARDRSSAGGRARFADRAATAGTRDRCARTAPSRPRYR